MSDYMSGQTREPKGYAKLFLAIGLIFACDLIAGIAAFIFNGLGIDFTVGHYLVAIPCYLIALAIIHGTSLAKPYRGLFMSSWRTGWWLILISLLLLMLDLVTYFDSTGLELVDNWPERLAQTVIICLGSGLTEEIAFRGLLLGALLAILGRTKKGIVLAVVISSVLFGFAHVFPLEEIGSTALVQAGLKALETAMFALLMSSIVIKTKSILGSASLHIFFNFCALVGGMLFTTTEFDVSYIDTGEMSGAIINTYVMLIILQLPIVVRAIKTLRATSAPNRGELWHYPNIEKNAQHLAATYTQEIPASFSTFTDENSQRTADGRPPLPLG